MDTLTLPAFRRARALSRGLSTLFCILICAGPALLAVVGVGFVVLYDDVYAAMTTRGMPAGMPPFLDIPRRLLLVGFALLYCAPLWLAAAYLRALFASFARGAVFTSENVTRLRAVGTWLLVAALAANLVQLLYIVVIRPQEADFSLTLLPAVYAAMIHVIAYVLEEANRLAEENGRFV